MRTCSICNRNYDDSTISCPYCSASDVMRLNWMEWITQVEMEYSKALGEDYLAKGLQKDAIQNGWGARLYKKGTGWSFEFELVKDEKRGNFLSATDEMSHGLTGPDMKEIKDLNKLKDKSYRLARFRSMLYSGDNQQGAGKFGRGKTLYLAASKRHHIIYDSLTRNGEYKLGFTRIEGDELKNSKTIFIGDQARKYLKERVSEKIKPLSKCGTRIIIVEPKKELINAVRAGLLAKYIGDTWWPILKRGLKIAVTYEGKREQAKVPREFKDLKSIDTEERKCRTYPVTFDYKGTKCRFKNIQLFLSKKGSVPEHIQGIHLYRREMKIGMLDVRELPPEIAEKFYGYAELETLSRLENIYMEQAVEGLDHSSFDGHKGIFQAMKREIQERFNKFKDEMGYGYYKGQEERKTKEASERALMELEKDWPDLVGLSEGTPRHPEKKIKISLVSLQFPRLEKFVNLGEDLTNIIFRIKNISSGDLSLTVTIKTIDENHRLIEELVREDINIAVNKSCKTVPLGFSVTSSKYACERFYLTCSCVNARGEIEDEKRVLIHVGPVVKPPLFKPLTIEKVSINFPKERRADFGQKVTQIEYNVKNETCIKISARFILRAMESPPKQQSILIYEGDFELSPNGEEEIMCPDFEIESEKYKMLLEGGEKGPVVLRATVVNLEQFFVNVGSDVKTYGKADRLAICDTKFWINCEAGGGIFDKTGSWKAGADEPKSTLEGSTFILNSTHPEFNIVVDSKDEIRRKNYIYEQQCRQALLLILKKNMLDKWPAHPRYPECKKDIEKEKVSKLDFAESIFTILDYRLSVHYK